MKAQVLGTAACLLALAMAGCAGDDFPAIPAPVWESGFEWTYAVDSIDETTGRDGEPKRNSNSEQITVRVTNTTLTHEGEPLYVVDVDEDGYSLLPPKGWTALRQSDLALVAGPGFVGHACELKSRPAAAVLPFPLQSGASWELPVFGYLPVVLTGTILGQETVDVPAGRFTAIHGRLEGAQTGGEGAYSVRSDFWYSPEARYFVKLHEIVTYTDRPALPPLAGEYVGRLEVTVELESLSLEAGPAGLAAPTIGDAPEGAGNERSFGLVMDREMPARAEPGATVRLGLEEIADANYAGFGFRLVEHVPEAVAIDHEQQQVLWTATRNGDPVAMHRGDHWDFPLDRAGQFSIQAAFDTVAAEGSSGACSDSSDAFYGTLDVYWEKEFTVPVAGGQPATIDVGHVPVEPVDQADAYPVADITARWTFERTGSPLEDQGTPRFQTPSGATLPSFDSGASFPATESGPWPVAWEATGQWPPIHGTLPTLTRPIVPLVEGEDVTLTIRVVYG